VTEHGRHSLPANRRLNHGDRRQVELGVTITHAGESRICQSGLHASPTPRTMFDYTAGPVICYVSCADIREQQNDKFVCRSRTVLWWADCTDMLREFACWAALSVSHLWHMPDVVRRCLDGTDRSKSARAAACAVVWDAPRDTQNAKLLEMLSELGWKEVKE